MERGRGLYSGISKWEVSDNSDWNLGGGPGRDVMCVICLYVHDGTREVVMKLENC